MDNFDVILRFLLDQTAQAKTETGVKSMNQSLDDTQKLAEAIDKTFAQFEERIKNATSLKEVESLERQFKDVKAAIKEAEDAAKTKATETAKAAKQETDAYARQARLMRAEAAALTSDFEKARLAQLNQIGSQIGGFGRTALGLGAGLVGGIFAGAAKYVKDAKEATAITRQWKAEQDAIVRSGERIGAVLARESLPLLRQAANLTEKVSRIFEANPQIAGIALNAGVILSTLGAIGIAVDKAIKVYTNIQTLALGSEQIAAAKLQDLAADKQLAAARLQASAGGLDVPKGGAAAGGAGALGTAGLFATLIGASALASNSVANNINKLGLEVGKLTNNAGAGATVINVLTSALTPIMPLLPGIQALKANLPQALQLLSKFGIELGAQQRGTTGGRTPTMSDTRGGALNVSLSPAFEQILNAYEDYQADDLALVQQHYLERQGIVQDALNAELAENKKYANAVAKVNANTASALEDAAQDFERANIRAEQRYQEQRAQIIKDGNEDIEKLEEDSRERIRKLTLEHNDRVASLTAQRDALGLVNERRDFNRQVAEEKRQTNQEIRERREAIQQRLADLKQSYEQERAERLADYQQRVAEIQEQAAERLKELAQEHAEELKQIREQRAAKLRELDAEFNAERLRRREYFIAQIRDLDAGLLGERNLKLQYQQLEINDLNLFLSSYRAKLASLGGSTTTGTTGGFTHNAAGGYVSGFIHTGEEGVEWLASNRTVKAAEQIIGGRLTQEGLIAALAGARGGSHRSLTINDGSRFDGRISASQVMAIKRELRDDVIKEFLNA